MLENITILLVIGLGFFVAGILIAVAISGKRLIDVFKDNQKQILVLLAIALILPTSVSLVFAPTSLTSNAQKEESPLNANKTYQISFKTSASASAYLIYQDSATLDTTIVDPKDGFQTQTIEHFFEIPNVAPTGGVITIYVDGQKYTGANNPFPIVPAK